jgi:hypothetical protein
MNAELAKWEALFHRLTSMPEAEFAPIARPAEEARQLRSQGWSTRRLGKRTALPTRLSPVSLHKGMMASSPWSTTVPYGAERCP